MKFILFNINDTNKNFIHNIQLGNELYLNEVSISKKVLDSMDRQPQGVIQRVKYNLMDKNIEGKIFKALEKSTEKWQYILAKDFPKSKYVMNKIQELLGCKYTSSDELDANLFKYIDEFLEANSSLNKHELKILIVANINRSINFTLIESLIKEFKNVNIYLNEIPSSYTLKRINQINKSEGSTIDILKKERKTFKEYNVIYFVDDKKENYPRFRIDKNTLVIDAALKLTDKFNSNLIYIDEYLKREDEYKEQINNLLKQYNRIELAGVIRKNVNN